MKICYYYTIIKVKAIKLKREKFLVSRPNWHLREFDSTSAADLTAYQQYLENQSWDTGCPFYLEWPYHDIPRMIEHKIVARYLEDLIRVAKKK